MCTHRVFLFLSVGEEDASNLLLATSTLLPHLSLPCNHFSLYCYWYLYRRCCWWRCLALASGAAPSPLPPPTAQPSPPPPHGFGVLHGVLPKCWSGSVVLLLRFRGFLRLRGEERCRGGAGAVVICGGIDGCCWACCSPLRRRRRRRV